MEPMEAGSKDDIKGNIRATPSALSSAYFIQGHSSLRSREAAKKGNIYNYELWFLLLSTIESGKSSVGCEVS